MPTPKPTYQRLAEKGRITPKGLTYINSWIGDDFVTCWQLMETDDPTNFPAWNQNWDGLMEFEVFPALNSAEARVKSGT